MWGIGADLSRIEVWASHVEPKLDAIRASVTVRRPASLREATVAEALASSMLEPLREQVLALCVALAQAGRKIDRREAMPWRLSRQERFRERQRLASYHAQFRQVQRLLQRLLGKMADIAAALRAPDLKQLIEESLDLAEQLDAAGDAAEVLAAKLQAATARQTVATIGAPHHEGLSERSMLEGLTIEQGVALLWILYLLLTWPRRRP